jgi:hypothetical protein
MSISIVTTPAQSTSHLLAPFYLICVVLVGFGLVGLLQHIAAMEPDGVLAKIVDYGAVDRYFAAVMDPLRRFRFLAWLVNYAPLALVAGSVVVLIAVKIYKILRPEAEKILLSSNEFDLIHRGVDMPAINHLESILLLCPNPDDGTLKEDLYRAGIHPEAPPSSATDIQDAPLTGYADPSRNRNPTAKP